MRLRLKSVAAAGVPLVRTVGKYIVLNVEPESLVAGLPLFWRLVDPVFSLVELALDPGSGGFRYFKVPLYNGQILEREVSLGDDVRTMIGLPCFEVDLWSASPVLPSGHYYSVPGQCECWMYNKDLCIQLFDERVDHCVQPHPGLKMCFNEKGELCGVVAPNLSSEDLLQLYKEISCSR